MQEIQIEDSLSSASRGITLMNKMRQALAKSDMSFQKAYKLLDRNGTGKFFESMTLQDGSVDT